MFGGARPKERKVKEKVKTRKERLKDREKDDPCMTTAEHLRLSDENEGKLEATDKTINKCMIPDPRDNKLQEIIFSERTKFCVNIYCNVDGFECENEEIVCEHVYIDGRDMVKKVYQFKEITSLMSRNYQLKMMHKSDIRRTIESRLKIIDTLEVQVERFKKEKLKDDEIISVPINTVFSEIIEPLIGAPREELLYFYNKIHYSPVCPLIVLPMFRTGVNNGSKQMYFQRPEEIEETDEIKRVNKIKNLMKWKHQTCNNFPLCENKENLQHCSHCHTVVYCSKKCQTLNWTHHKLVCYKHKLIFHRPDMHEMD